MIMKLRGSTTPGFCISRWHWEFGPFGNAPLNCHYSLPLVISFIRAAIQPPSPPKAIMKRQHKPLVEHKITSLFCVLFLTATFVLLLLVGLSLTIIKPIYIIRVFSIRTGQPATSLATELRFGVWGVCASSALDAPTAFENDGPCFGPQLGYASFTDLIPEDFLQHFGLTDGIVNTVLKGLLTILVLHLVAAGFSLFGLVTALFLASHTLTILSLVLTIITSLLTTIVFAIDLVIIVATKSQLPKLTNNGVAVGTGNAVWMVLGALIATWLAVIFLSARACYCCGVRRKGLDTY
ncbi:hypothetical protein E1B28_010221 [Marasmius oreades]|uniref:Pali-domain-containing protein n=1 Tax=Marasmius oreades TaxID=181124 RepID=A0A9P7RWR4_9AGAR|nr:uncharacterized protein E1B28_010221 [Marasmius oreades]KAG7091169.1 hypothetical protein E1B28_010221 [Marasmius oreades]